MAKIEPIHTDNGMHPDVMLDEWKGHLSDCLLIGLDHDGALIISTSNTDPAHIIVQLERAKRLVMEATYSHD